MFDFVPSGGGNDPSVTAILRLRPEFSFVAEERPDFASHAYDQLPLRALKETFEIVVAEVLSYGLCLKDMIEDENVPEEVKASLMKSVAEGEQLIAVFPQSRKLTFLQMMKDKNVRKVVESYEFRSPDDGPGGI